MQNTILDREWRYSYLYKITNKESKLITFSPNSVQKFVRAHELHLRKEYGVVRLVILKGRQLGMTTYNLIKALDRVLFYRNQTVVIIPHLAKDEQDFFDNVQALYKNIPERIADERYPGGVWVKPKPKYSTRKEMIFEGMNSTIQIKSQTRGKTVSHLHITELAFNENASKMMTGALPSMPENADIIIESTANGIGNYYYNLWNSNVDNPDPEFHCLFVPWYLEDRYRSDRHRDIPGELKTLKRIFADGTIDQEQVNWYVKMYNSLEGMDVLQEYPSTPEEAFLATGDMFFDKDIVMWLEVLDYEQDSVYPHMRIYNPDLEKTGVLFGIDTSMGGENSDYCGVTIRARTWELLACYQDRVKPHDLCNVIQRFYDLWYHWVIGAEKNGESGGAFLEASKAYEWHTDIYMETAIDTSTQRETRKYGWSTNAKTRPIMLFSAMEALMKGWITQYDDRQKREMLTFVTIDWKPQAQVGCHDDLVMADSICWQMRNTQQHIEMTY